MMRMSARSVHGFNRPQPVASQGAVGTNSEEKCIGALGSPFVTYGEASPSIADPGATIAGLSVPVAAHAVGTSLGVSVLVATNGEASFSAVPTALKRLSVLYGAADTDGNRLSNPDDLGREKNPLNGDTDVDRFDAGAEVYKIVSARRWQLRRELCRHNPGGRGEGVRVGQQCFPGSGSVPTREGVATGVGSERRQSTGGVVSLGGCEASIQCGESCAVKRGGKPSIC